MADDTYGLSGMSLRKREDRCDHSCLHLDRNLSARSTSARAELVESCKAFILPEFIEPLSRPVADIEFDQGVLDSNVNTLLTSDRFGRLPAAFKRARIYCVDPYAGELCGEFAGLGPPEIVKPKALHSSGVKMVDRVRHCVTYKQEFGHTSGCHEYTKSPDFPGRDRRTVMSSSRGGSIIYY